VAAFGYQHFICSLKIHTSISLRSDLTIIPYTQRRSFTSPNQNQVSATHCLVNPHQEDSTAHSQKCDVTTPRSSDCSVRLKAEVALLKDSHLEDSENGFRNSAPIELTLLVVQNVQDKFHLTQSTRRIVSCDRVSK